MPTSNRSLPDRPPTCTYSSIAELLTAFADIFLGGDACIRSGCGHEIQVYDHHFFHLASVQKEGCGRLFMADEKAEICSTTAGAGRYLVGHQGARARALASAKATMEDPDEVWEDNPKATSAKWVYVKEFNSLPYPFTVAFLALRPQQNIIVPVSSFPCRRNDCKKWRKGKLIYQKHEQPS